MNNKSQQYHIFLLSYVFLVSLKSHLFELNSSLIPHYNLSLTIIHHLDHQLIN